MPELARRIIAVPEPYRANLVEWLAHNLNQPIEPHRDLATTVNELLYTVHRAGWNSLIAVLDEAEHFFGAARRAGRIDRPCNEEAITQD